MGTLTRFFFRAPTPPPNRGNHPRVGIPPAGLQPRPPPGGGHYPRRAELLLGRSASIPWGGILVYGFLANLLYILGEIPTRW